MERTIKKNWEQLWKELRAKTLVGGTIEIGWNVGFSMADMQHVRARISSVRWLRGKPHIISFERVRFFDDWDTLDAKSRVDNKKRSVSWRKPAKGFNETFINCQKVPRHAFGKFRDIYLLDSIRKTNGAYGFIAADRSTHVAVYPADIKVPQKRLFFGTGKHQTKKFSRLMKNLFKKKKLTRKPATQAT